jgi:peptidoglycan hydrolase-like protein with peptidoglycan-binding domain
LRSQAIAVVLALNLALALALSAATPAKKTKPVGTKKTATKASAANASKAKGKTASRNTTGKKAAAGKKSTATKKTSAQPTTSRFRRSSQREPAPERYQEIQQSLAEKGYFSGPVNGAWGADSVAALKRFQRDQNIGDDGKLGSLSLIALGLGPKRGSALGSSPEPGAPDDGTPARSEQ